MRIYQTIEEFSPSSLSLALTIGNFDGVHLGHQTLLRRLKEAQSGQTVVLSFSNHPSEILRPSCIVPKLCSLAHKFRLLEQEGIDALLSIPFTKELSQQTAEQFLKHLREYIPFTHLILGHDATLGKNREGNRAQIYRIAKKQSFYLEYLEPFILNDKPVSSTEIREFLRQGLLERASQALGRPYSIFGPVVSGRGQGARLGYPTANIDVDQLALPPWGVYAVEAVLSKKKWPAIANLGVAPTFHSTQTPRLETHILDYQANVYDKNMEVVFLKYLRPEKKFETLQQLQEQIQKDVASVKNGFSSSL